VGPRAGLNKAMARRKILCSCRESKPARPAHRLHSFVTPGMLRSPVMVRPDLPAEFLTSVCVWGVSCALEFGPTQTLSVHLSGVTTLVHLLSVHHTDVRTPQLHHHRHLLFQKLFLPWNTSKHTFLFVLTDSCAV
jgi:hypothetical protein